MAPIGPRKDSDHPRNMKPRKTSSSMIGPARHPPTKNTNKPPAPPTIYGELTVGAEEKNADSATINAAVTAKASSNSLRLGQFNARYSVKSLPAFRIATHSTASVGKNAIIMATPYQCPFMANA